MLPRLIFFCQTSFRSSTALIPALVQIHNRNILQIKMHQDLVIENKFAFYFNLICWTSFAPCRRKPDHWKSFCGRKSETKVTSIGYNGQSRTRNHLETSFLFLCVINCDLYWERGLKRFLYSASICINWQNVCKYIAVSTVWSSGTVKK